MGGVEVREFQEFIEGNILLDLGFIGTQFILCSNHYRGARVWERIDKAFT